MIQIKLSQIELQDRILKLDEFTPDAEGIKKLVENGEKLNIDDLLKAIQNLIAAEKLDTITEPDGPKYKPNRNKRVGVSKFLQNLREIHETGGLGKSN